MKKIFGIAVASLAASLISVTAQAAPVDFVSYAAAVGEHGVASGTSVNVGGVNMTLVSNNNYNPYFDDVDNVSRKPGGLGVCRTLGTIGNASNQCVPGNDDSIDGAGGINENIKILFDDGPFDVRQLSFNDGQHNGLNANNVGQVTYMILDAFGGILSSATTNFANLVAMAAAGTFLQVAGIGFEFYDTKFYIDTVSDVPLPAALPLLLSGLAGLGFAARRKKVR